MNRFLWAIVIVVACVTGFVVREPLLTRTTVSSRLETKSLDERVLSWQQGVLLAREHPLMGVGPNATILALAPREPWNRGDLSLGPPVPPHSVPLLIVDEIGLVGLLGIVLLFFTRSSRLFFVPTTLSLIIISLLDHYPWSLWSGHVLVALVIAMAWL